MSNIDNTPIELPIDQGEQAHQPARKNLLAQEVYKEIERHINDSLAKLPTGTDSGKIDLDKHRSHQAILIDGGRGTGKSSVLVNLATYMEDASKLLILKPVDPTLLENGDDLLLNVIVAALMRDESVQRDLQNDEHTAEKFYDQLHKLGSALEGIQKQKQQYGLDKLRAFMGNQVLAERVHELLQTALTLTKKRIVILPIDDVDTSLQLAFDNIEVVRKYLTSPYVVPIISGDLNLYNEVIWREFYSRLTQKEKVQDGPTQDQARELAEEYQRKVLPLPRRIDLPQLSTYINNKNIMLTQQGVTLAPLSLIEHWLDALLNERVNGEERSRCKFPLKTVREMTQFISSTRHLIPQLKAHLKLDATVATSVDFPTRLKRKIFMSDSIADAVQTFEKNYKDAQKFDHQLNRKSRTRREAAYKKFKDQVASDDSKTLQDAEIHEHWYEAIAKHFGHQHDGGPAYLIASTNLSWIKENKTASEHSVLQNELFQPLTQTGKKFEQFKTHSHVMLSWSDTLKGKVPSAWLNRLPEKTVLPYPSPEKGQTIKGTISGPWAFDPYFDHTLRGEAEFVRRLMTHWSFYSSNQRSNLILTGRLFELIVLSFIRDIEPTDIMQLLSRPPFYSLPAIADSKALTLTITDEDEQHLGRANEIENSTETDEQDEIFEDVIIRISNNINRWREKLDIQVPHSWLIYNTMNKFFNQADYFLSHTKKSNAVLPQLKTIVDTAVQSFDSLWAAFGSFEKGEVFGFPRVIANVNMTTADKDFEQSILYRQNILPFLQNRDNDGFFDFHTGAYTFSLETHPIRQIFRNLHRTLSATGSLSATLPAITSKMFSATTTNKTDVALDKIFNETAKKMGIALNNETIASIDSTTNIRLINNVYEQCNTAELISAFEAVKHEPDLPVRSGRQKLRYCLIRQAEFESSSNSQKS